MTSLPLVLLAACIFADDPVTITPIDKAATATISVKGYPDWLEIGFGSLWVSNAGVGAVQRIDPQTNKVIAEVNINQPVAAMAVGFGSVWVASRKDKSIVRIDAKTNTVIAAIPIPTLQPIRKRASRPRKPEVGCLTNRKRQHPLPNRPETNKVVSQITLQ